MKKRIRSNAMTGKHLHFPPLGIQNTIKGMPMPTQNQLKGVYEDFPCSYCFVLGFFF